MRHLKSNHPQGAVQNLHVKLKRIMNQDFQTHSEDCFLFLFFHQRVKKGAALRDPQMWTHNTEAKKK